MAKSDFDPSHAGATPLRQAWREFRRPLRLLAVAIAALVIVGGGVLHASGMHSSCSGKCPTEPVTSAGQVVSDRFYFLHRDLPAKGSMTVRMTAMTGTRTYPPPDHDKIIAGLVPWAKAGIIIKDGVRRGSTYAALMMTGDHGVRMQYDYEHDIAGRAGRPGDLSTRTPRWLRLTRSGDTITGSESTDGRTWRTVGTTTLEGLPETAQVGLFATSPGDLTLRRVALGATLPESRFTQAKGVFDNIGLKGAAPGAWRSDAVGEMNHTDWEKDHNPSGAVEAGGRITISGTGDIGPVPIEAPITIDRALGGAAVALIILLVVGARFGSKTYAGQVATRRTLAAKAVVLGSAVFATTLLAVALTVPLGTAILKGNGVDVPPTSLLTIVRVVVGSAAVLALSAVLALALGSLLRRGWAAILVVLAGLGLPYLIGSVPLLPDSWSEALLRFTPAAGFAVQQIATEYPQVTGHFVPISGYFPLPWWAGFAVLAAYTVCVYLPARRRLPTGLQPDFR